MDKHTKILIPEIPGEWTQRTRSGHTNIWNDAEHHRFHRTTTDLLQVRMEPPERGLFAERIDGAWYWVCGCEQCLGNEDKHSYIVCHEHNRCATCATHNDDLAEGVTRWGLLSGFRCSVCQDRLDAEAKANALARVAAEEYDPWDYRAQDECKCPHCATEIHVETEDYGDKQMDCDTCGGVFELTIEYSVTFTTKVVGERIKL